MSIPGFELQVRSCAITRCIVDAQSHAVASTACIPLLQSLTASHVATVPLTHPGHCLARTRTTVCTFRLALAATEVEFAAPVCTPFMRAPQERELLAGRLGAEATAGSGTVKGEFDRFVRRHRATHRERWVEELRARRQPIGDGHAHKACEHRCDLPTNRQPAGGTIRAGRKTVARQ